jgi:hypothetical protein
LNTLSAPEELERIDGPKTEYLQANLDDSLVTSHVGTFKNQEDLKQKLQEAQKDGKMPVIMTVAGHDKFFHKDNDIREAHKLDHVLCIDKYNEDGTVVVNNQWGSKGNWGTKEIGGSPASDKDTHPAASINDFFPATQNL